ncbi:shikimate dehydrogenase [Streptomyces sp. PT12]|uniref:shikimate dehydrogenase family protein n=1 Tax=Streptomyces sp. PT12 TaxID=1510197 RepID=UPI000DE270D0|nr:shikimate dehydrogenase [Streptomyces sp. PT12]RBM10958.1 shikimate dehydrogenase [Streptomyces sp. PT12]
MTELLPPRVPDAPAAPTGPAPVAIDGSTRLFAVLGDPVAQVKAPALLNPLFARLGLNAVLFPVHVPPDRLADVVHGLRGVANLDGLLVTVPHKFAAGRLAARRSRAAELIGGVNALRRGPDGAWEGDNFDGAGFVGGLRRAGFDPRGWRAALAGAGGAGAAIAVALLDAGVGHLSVWDQDPDRLDALTGRLARHWPGRVTGAAEPLLAGADLAVNATPLGLRRGDPLPFRPAALPPGAVVADIVMTPAETALLRVAAGVGLRTHRGSHMLEAQLELYQDFFGLHPTPGTRR